MMFWKTTWFFSCLLAASPLVAQKLKKADKRIVDNLKAHVTFLASDKLEGRRAGTNGEKLALDYIKTQFRKTGLAPKGENADYIQPFPIPDGKTYKGSFFFINDQEIKAGQYFPLPNSPDVSLEAAPSIALNEAGVPWFLDLKDDIQTVSANPHTTLIEFVSDKARDAAKKGAKALIVYDSDDKASIREFDANDHASPLPIPVIFVNSQVSRRYFSDVSATLDIRLKVKINELFRTANNVIGYLDNGAATTVVIGAHYDHIGYGEDGNALSPVKDKQVYNGADDNASGVAGLLELSQMLKNSKLKNNNYLFIAFSGEETGLLGSKYFMEHPTVDPGKINYMINMDMIGRLNDSTKSVIIGGYATSPTWAQLTGKVKNDAHLSFKYDSSGAGPSDHTSFYRKNIPVLFFFTGTHSDHHRPDDDFNKINYVGEYRLLQYIYAVIESANGRGRLAFTKTKEFPAGSVPSFTVGLGIMPDYTYNGIGVRIDGVTEGRAAQKAGLKSGDIVVELGNKPVSSLQQYMQLLSTYKKGDSTKVTVKRSSETIEADIEF